MASSPGLTPPFTVTGRLGAGAFSEVLAATDARSRNVALKRVFLRGGGGGSFPAAAYRERAAHACLSHPHVVACLGSFAEAHALTLVLEPYAADLGALLQHAAPRGLPERTVRVIAGDILQGLSHIHANGIMHRDVKPANVLIGDDGVTRVGDLGLARPFARPDDNVVYDPSGGGVLRHVHERCYTGQVSSRWYRAPEICFGSRTYGPAIDVWAVGTILAELFTGVPLCAGGSDIEQLACITALLGPATCDEWPDAPHTLPDWGKITFLPLSTPPRAAQCFESVLMCSVGEGEGGGASAAARDLLSRLLTWDPSRRLSAADALRHPFFDAASSRTSREEIASLASATLVARRATERSQAAAAPAAGWVEWGDDDEDDDVHTTS